MSECRAWTVPDETCRVIVRFPKPLRTRIAETWNDYKFCCKCMFLIFLFLSLFFIVYVFSIYGLVRCLEEPGMGLESLSIRDMAVYQNTTSTAWQVDSAFNVTLSTWNHNTCWITYRRVTVRVEYKNQTMLQQEVPLGFRLKPQRSRPVTMELEAQEVQLQKPDQGPILQAEMRGGNVTLDVYFDARYLTNGRTPGWVRFSCLLVVPTPSNSSASSLLNKHCVST